MNICSVNFLFVVYSMSIWWQWFPLKWMLFCWVLYENIVNMCVSLLMLDISSVNNFSFDSGNNRKMKLVCLSISDAICMFHCFSLLLITFIRNCFVFFFCCRKTLIHAEHYQRPNNTNQNKIFVLFHNRESLNLLLFFYLFCSFLFLVFICNWINMQIKKRWRFLLFWCIQNTHLVECFDAVAQECWMLFVVQKYFFLFDVSVCRFFLRYLWAKYEKERGWCLYPKYAFVFINVLLLCAFRYRVIFICVTFQKIVSHMYLTLRLQSFLFHFSFSCFLFSIEYKFERMRCVLCTLIFCFVK